MKKEAMNVKESREEYMGWFGGRKGWEEMLKKNLHFFLKEKVRGIQAGGTHSESSPGWQWQTDLCDFEAGLVLGNFFY